MNQQNIINLYNEGKSAYEILEMTNYKSVNSIYNIIRKNTTVRSRAGNKNPNLKHDFFDTIDTELKAYFLGFIMADGSITIRENSQPCLSIEIKKEDKYILEAFKKVIFTDNEISDCRKDCCRIRIHSNRLIDDLSKYNIVPNKSHLSNPLIIIPEPYMSHFVRGLFDGDGWIYKRKYGLNIGFCGTYESMISLEEYLRQQLDLPQIKVGQYKNKVPFFVHANKDSIRKLYDYMYKDATIYLHRKENKFKES